MNESKTPLKALIVEDEIKLAEVLRIKINRIAEDITIVGHAMNVDAAIQMIAATSPQLVFLDISMPKKSGFVLLENYNPVPFEVIFVTGYGEYALDALKVSAIDYLLKPVKTEDLANAIKKAKRKLERNQKLSQFDVLKHNLIHIGNQETKIVIPGTSAYDFVFVKDIIRCEGFQKYTYIYLNNQKKILSSYNIGVYKEMLKNYAFFSTHKSHLINTIHVKRYLIEGSVIMTDGSTVPLSRRRREAFTNTLIKPI